MPSDYTHFVNVAKEVEPPDDGILTRTLLNDDDVKAIIFGFGAGQELSEHTASMPAILQVIEGGATVSGEDEDKEPRGNRSNRR